MILSETSSRPQLFWTFARTRELPELGPGPRSAVLSRRDLGTCLDEFARDHQLDDGTLLRLKAAALLYHDHHDPAHDIVQDLPDIDAALIHGILHRREPDYWNARYWFRRFDAHPVYLSLGRRLSVLARTPQQKELARQLTLPGGFDPFAFIDQCEIHERRPAGDPVVDWLREVQHAEFEELVSHLLR